VAFLLVLVDLGFSGGCEARFDVLAGVIELVVTELVVTEVEVPVCVVVLALVDGALKVTDCRFVIDFRLFAANCRFCSAS